MAVIQIQDYYFAYDGNITPVFEGLNFRMDSSWRLGLVGRNGRGKTTMLRLLAGQLQGHGQIISSLPFDLFPYEVDMDRPAGEALIDALAPFTQWEKQMQALLSQSTPKALHLYGEIEHQYSLKDGYVIRDYLARETALLGIPEDALSRPLSTFSPGEQTRLKLAALFLRRGSFLLIDEPTNHLDTAGRELVANFLKSKSGFLAVSHDRDLLDKVCTHILALEKQGARVVAGNYSTYRQNKRNQDELEREKNERIKADIKRLRQSAREKADWSDRVEATKIGQGACDRGFIGHKAAKAMKRSKAIETRITRQIKEQESLLQNMEQTASLKLQPLPPMGPVVMRFDKVNFGYGDKPFIQQMDLVLKPGDRLAVTGNNGSGKTTLLKLMKGDIAPSSGNIWQPRGLITSYLPQTSAHLSGTPRELVLQTGLDLTLFFALLRKFDFARELFDRDIRGFSLGQRKKVLLATTLAQPAHLYLWDEPLNDIDPESREQIEDMLSDTGATMVFIEHERAFLDKIKTREITLSPASCG